MTAIEKRLKELEEKDERLKNTRHFHAVVGVLLSFCVRASPTTYVEKANSRWPT
jgi:hypothetical protein